MATINATTQSLRITDIDTAVFRTSIIWPNGLPQYFFARQYNETPRQQFLRSNVDIGLSQVRRRYTQDIVDIEGSMRMSQDQVTILYSWFNDILLGGTLIFRMMNALTLQYRSVRFKKPFVISHEGGVYYQVSLSLEVIP